MQVPPFSLSQQIAELGSDLDSAVLNVLHSGQYIGGIEIENFETAFASSIEVPYAVGCNSGTDALILALRALEIGIGDEVITSSFSFFATAEAISAVGAKPVFVDVDPDTYLIDIQLVEAAITSSTKALLPVHLFGCPVDMDQIITLAKKYKLKVIEDCAQAAGAVWNGRPVGSWGDIGCYSFFPTKNLGAAGDAGAITTHDQNIAKLIRELAVHGMPKRYIHTNLGYNSRLDALQAAVLNVKLPKLKKWIQQRKKISEYYQKMLNNLSCLKLPSNSSQINSLHAWNQFVIRIIDFPDKTFHSNKEFSLEVNEYGLKVGVGRDWLKENLSKAGVNTIIYYPIPIHLQPAYKSFGYKPGHLPVTEKLCGEVLSLPIFPELTIDHQDKVVNEITTLLKETSYDEVKVVV